MSDERSAELVLVRHGATALGDETVLGTQSDPPLSPEGVEQARRVALRLAAEPIDALFVTPLRRTAQSAQPLADMLRIEPVVVPDLCEVHLGELERTLGLPEHRGEAMREILRRQRWDVAAGAEEEAAFAERVRRGLASIAAAAGAAGRVVAFVHGGVIAEACRVATGSTPLAFVPHLHHAAMTRLHYGRARITLAVFNDTAHLEGTPSG